MGLLTEKSNRKLLNWRNYMKSKWGGSNTNKSNDILALLSSVFADSYKTLSECKQKWYQDWESRECCHWQCWQCLPKAHVCMCLYISSNSFQVRLPSEVSPSIIINQFHTYLLKAPGLTRNSREMKNYANIPDST